MTRRTASISRPWVYATVFGSLWGAIEITVGALIHSMRIPLAGVWMAAVGTIILFSGLVIYPRRGFAIRAGVVCVLLKLINPSVAFVLASISIFTEAVVVEIAAGDGRFGSVRAAVVGGVVVTLPFFQYLLHAWLIYGWDIVRIYTVGFERFVSWIDVSPFAGYGVLAAILLALFAIGCASGLAGLYMGRKALSLKDLYENFS